MPENTAIVNGSTGNILDLFRNEAVAHDLAFVEHVDGLEIITQYGRIAASVEGGAVKLALTAETDGNLHVMRDAIQSHLGPGHVLEWTGVPVGRPANLTVLALDRLWQISPSFLRMRLIGDVGHLAHGGFHIRLIAPASIGQTWPVVTAGGRTVWSKNTPLPHRPVYTIARREEDAIEIDIFQHISGRTQKWAQTLRKGDAVGIMGPGGSSIPNASRISMWGDETALPAMLRIIADAPDGMHGRATFFVKHPSDVRQVRSDHFSLRWVIRDCPCHLAERVKSEQAVETGAFLWVATGALETRLIKELVARASRPKTTTYVATYWK